MKTGEKIIESTVKVRFPDCDPFNHLNNSRYLDYVLNAREDQLAQFYDFDIHKMAMESGETWVVAQTKINYFLPAYLMETVVIQTRLIGFDQKNLFLEALMWDAEKKQLKAVLWMRFTHFNLRTQRSQVHSEELMEFFGEVVYPLPIGLDYDGRVKELVSAMKEARQA